MTVTLMIRKESLGEALEPEVGLVNCVSKGGFALLLWPDCEIRVRGKLMWFVPACPKSYYNSMKDIGSSKKSPFINGDPVFVETVMTTNIGII